ncbi:unnamed protein product [Didymodactylos carnosus]|uniref:Uncharacterized protein n=1 Tax=Didymodactylos carnosus TaxID=1234261 RepID=A0A8S2XLZ6_9BILA|nr:unnamed protein product [Didymodactylos carnosus]
MSNIIVDLEKPTVLELLNTLKSAEKLYKLPQNIENNRVYRLCLIEKCKDLGNKEYAELRPRGNVKKSKIAAPFRRTLPSTLSEIRETVQHNTGAKVYKFIVATSETETSRPRNIKQVNNLREGFLSKHHPTNDEILNVILMSYEINDYIRLASFPNLTVVLIHIVRTFRIKLFICHYHSSSVLSLSGTSSTTTALIVNEHLP